MSQIRFGACMLDLDTHRLYRDSQPVHITPKAFELLRILAQHAPKALSKAELLDRLWPNTFVSHDVLARLVSDLRQAIGDRAREPNIIRTVHRFGYAFDARLDGAESPTRQAPCKLSWANREFRLAEGENIIGRQPDVAVPINAAIVSRQHARIVVTGDTARLEDLTSKNGTFVGGTRVTEPRVLQHGDIIKVGDYELTFHVASPDLPTLTNQP